MFDSEMCFVSFVHVLVYVFVVASFSISSSWVFVWIPGRGVIVVKFAVVVSLPFAFSQACVVGSVCCRAHGLFVVHCSVA